jgi:serine/threonine protein kinase
MCQVGCILAEMVSLAPSFPGDSEIDTLFKIFQTTGTPTEESWPGVQSLKDWHIFPQWDPPSDQQFLHSLHIRPEHHFDVDGIHLLRSLLTLNPPSRLSAREALQHPWFTKAKLHNMSNRDRTKLDAHAAEVASAATVRAAERKAEKARKAAEAKAAEECEEDAEEMEEVEESESFEEMERREAEEAADREQDEEDEEMMHDDSGDSFSSESS